jgi:DNA adenine methylase
MGGKEQLAALIVAQFPECEVFVEPFGGAASVLFAREFKSNVLEVYNDVFEGVVNLFKTLRDDGDELHRRLELTPYSEREYEKALDWEKETDLIESARKFYVVIRQGFNALMAHKSGWARAFVTKNVHSWIHSIERLPRIIQRLKNIQIECADWREVCEKYDRPETLLYLDPPYVQETRITHNIYDVEFTDEEHRDLIKFMLGSVSMIALSGYESEMYRTLEEHGWKRIDWFRLCYGASTRNGRAKTWRVESLWLNPLLQQSKEFEDSHRYLAS